MASNAAFTVIDGDTANHVFSPMGIDGRTASYQNLGEAIANGRETVRMSHKDGAVVREVSVAVRVPQVVSTTIDGVTRRKVEDFGSVTMKFVTPVSWTPAQKEILRTVAAGLLAATPVVKLVDDDEFVW